MRDSVQKPSTEQLSKLWAAATPFELKWCVSASSSEVHEAALIQFSVCLCNLLMLLGNYFNVQMWKLFTLFQKSEKNVFLMSFQKKIRSHPRPKKITHVKIQKT